MKIGILDSGVGGFSVLREIHELLPGFPIHYVADSSWCPYGNKPGEIIRERVSRIADYLLDAGAEILVIACNSATIHAVGSLRAAYPLPVVGMEPAVKPAAEWTKSGVVGVLATEASIAGEKFHQLVNTHARGIRVITKPCPKFVQLVEAGILEGQEVDDAVKDAVTPLLDAGADVLVLGCTHYPFLRTAIEARVPDHVRLIDTGPAVAKRTESFLTSSPDLSKEPAEIHIETTGSLEQLNLLLPKLLPEITASTSEAAF
ncbi:MAG: glutamate racemase [Verrucomicrobiota bacterium]